MQGFLSDFQRDLIAVGGIALAVVSSAITLVKALLANKTVPIGPASGSGLTRVPQSAATIKFANRASWEQVLSAVNAALFLLVSFVFADLQRIYPWTPYVWTNTFILGWAWLLLWLWLGISRKPFLALLKTVFLNPLAVMYYLCWLAFGVLKAVRSVFGYET